MPYSTIRDLPEQVKKAHPTARGQRAFLAAFNAAYAEHGGDEAAAFRIAHAAADRAEGKRPKRSVRSRRVK